MIVKFGVCINELGIDTRMSSLNDSYSVLEYYIFKKLDYCLRKCNDLYLLGIRHIRLPNLLPPNYDKENFNQLLDNIKRCSKYKLFKRLNISYSFHLPYKLSVKTSKDRIRTRKYITDLNKLMKALDLDNFTIVCHVKDSEVSKYNKFLSMISKLPTRYKKSIVIENDEYYTDLSGCVSLSSFFKVPIVLDNLHNKLNGNTDLNNDIMYSICDSWHYNNRPIKMHYSSYSGFSSNGHGSTIEVDELEDLLTRYKSYTNYLIVILEIKNSLSALEGLKYKTFNKWNWCEGLYMEI